MRKDPTEFRERFLRWKKGELVYENGLALPAYEDDKWNPNDTYTADAGMIKSKLAIASHFGNPTARRMTNYDGRDYTWPGEYEYINGVGEPKRGNVYVGSYDNLVTPQILDNGKTLEFIDNPWNSKNEQRSYKQSLKFDKMRDAWSFGENYKKYAPMMNNYEDGKLPEYKGGKYPILGVGPILPSPLMAYILVKKGAQYLRDRAYKTVKPSGYNSQNIENFISNKNRMYTDPNTEALWGKYTNLDSVVADYTLAPKDMPMGRKMTRREMVNLGYNQNSLDLDNYAKYAVSDVIKPSSKKGAYEFIYPNTSGMVLHTPNNINDIPDDTWSHSHLLGTFHQTKGVDENGRYVSYEDTWDINPFRGKSSSDDPKLKYIIKAGKAMGLDQVGDIVPFGLPFEVYGKQYYDDNGRRIKK